MTAILARLEGPFQPLIEIPPKRAATTTANAQSAQTKQLAQITSQFLGEVLENGTVGLLKKLCSSGEAFENSPPPARLNGYEKKPVMGEA